MVTLRRPAETLGGPKSRNEIFTYNLTKVNCLPQKKRQEMRFFQKKRFPEITRNDHFYWEQMYKKIQKKSRKFKKIFKK